MINPFQHFYRMMKKYLFGLIVALCLVACDKEAADVLPDPAANAVELAGLETVVYSGVVARAPALDADNYVGRSAFVDGDQMVLTSVKRTAEVIPGFSYRGIVYNNVVGEGQTSGGWTRVENQGSTEAAPDQVPDRIYWSDATNPHTFIGYSLPQDRATFSWEESAGRYTGQLRAVSEDGQMIDHTSNERIKTDDLLLTYDTDKLAETGGSVAKLYFYHALANVRVMVNISGFSANDEAADVKTVVSNMVLKQMPVKYVWDQQSAGVTALPEAENEKMDTKMWIPRPAGTGTGVGKQFVFYALAVPTTGVSQTMTFDVTYPDPMNPNTTITKTYSAQYDGLEYRAGHCTTIHISLNHQDEKITVGAEYMDWQYVETPDQGELKKNTSLLTEGMLKRDTFTIATDAKANVDDATWLYFDGGTLKDIYGNTGTAAAPFCISTAQQLVSFAQEVTSGRTFEDQYVKLDADIVMQPRLFADTLEWVTWPGVGDESHAFNGKFLGGGRTVRNLYGSPFFSRLGDKAVVELLNFSDVIEVDGRGIVANESSALVVGVYVSGTVRQHRQANGAIYSGSLVGTNEGKGAVVACAHVGNVEAYASDEGAIGGLVGYNQGAMVACYHSGAEQNLDTLGTLLHPGIGKYDDTSYAYSCYFDDDIDPSVLTAIQFVHSKQCFPLKTSVMQSLKFVDSDLPVISHDLEDTEWYNSHLSLNKAISTFCAHIAAGTLPSSIQNASHSDWMKAHGSAYRFSYTPGTYPRIW